jgi:hypothetical protein
LTDRPSGRDRPSPVDVVLVCLGVLVAASTLLPWQRGCCHSSSNAWAGNGELAGGVTAGLALALAGLAAASLGGRRLPPPIPHDYVVLAVGTGAALFGLLKFLLVVGRHAAFGAWIGVVLSAAVGFAMAWRVRERRADSVRR